MDNKGGNGCKDECCLKCGNHHLDEGEQCDGDLEHCLPNCKVKKGYKCYNHDGGFVYCLPDCGDGY